MNTHESIRVKGEYFAFMLPPDTTEDSPIVEELRRQVRSGKVTAEHAYSKNIIPTTGRSVLARLLTGDTTYSGEVTDLAIGNGVSPVFTNASTTLVNEVYRKSVSSQARDGAIAYIDGFYAAGDLADGAYSEIGAFIDGDGSTPDDGQAWSLTALSIFKSGSLFVSARYTLS